MSLKHNIKEDNRGASLTGYGLVVGLIAVLAIAAVQNVGDSVSGLFTATGEKLETAGASSGGSGASSGGSSGSASSSGGGSPAMGVSPTSASGMDISSGSSPGATVVFTFTNTGDAATASLTTSMAGDSGNFNITADDCNGQSLGAGSSCDVDVQPVASVNGSYSATLTVGDGSVSADATLSGTASGFVLGTCLDYFNAGVTTSGPQTIDPDGVGTGDPSFTAYCNMGENLGSTGGGWTLTMAAMGSEPLYDYVFAIQSTANISDPYVSTSGRYHLLPSDHTQVMVACEPSGGSFKYLAFDNTNPDWWDTTIQRDVHSPVLPIIDTNFTDADVVSEGIDWYEGCTSGVDGCGATRNVFSIYPFVWGSRWNNIQTARRYCDGIEIGEASPGDNNDDWFWMYVR